MTYSLFFPQIGYEVYWSPEIVDLFAFFDNMNKNSLELKIKEVKLVFLLYIISKYDNIIYRETLLQLSDLVEEIAEHIPNIEASVYLNSSELSKNEITKFINALFKLYPNLVENFIKKFYIKGNINKAIESGNEIMVVANKLYMLRDRFINVDKFKKSIIV